MNSPSERWMAAIAEGMRQAALRYAGDHLIGRGRRTLDRWHRDVKHARGYAGGTLREIRAAKGVGNPRAVTKRREAA